MTWALAILALLGPGADRPVSLVPGCAAGNQAAYDVVVDPRDADRVFVAEDTVFGPSARGDCLARSDGGLVAPPPSFPRRAVPRSLTIDPLDPDRIFAATSQGLYRSVDGGRSWEFVFAPPALLGEAPVCCLAFAAGQPSVGYASGDGAVYKTINSGNKWTIRTNGFPAPPAALPGVSALAIDPGDPDVVYLASVGVYKTIDGGELWQRSSAGLPGGRVFAVAVDGADSELLYAGMGSGLYRSVDAAETWQPTAFSGRAVLDVRQNPSDLAVWLIGTDAGIFRSGDAGESWESLESPFSDAVVYRIAFAPSDSATIYAATSLGVFRTRDSGVHWSLLETARRVPRQVFRP